MKLSFFIATLLAFTTALPTPQEQVVAVDSAAGQNVEQAAESVSVLTPETTNPDAQGQAEAAAKAEAEKVDVVGACSDDITIPCSNDNQVVSINSIGGQNVEQAAESESVLTANTVSPDKNQQAQAEAKAEQDKQEVQNCVADDSVPCASE
ncbi:hypothetical protein HK099_007721 [Clydaea vesicula]|uniref:Uncharacterized protein n=1 Tax=Clydaea vesicula TaxID=447962 RepID=A0AAD5U0X1_9FUNG|nr:hypothetical protein HK099_007721 [Clydaea vesicula]KAJ3380392.1 hypothetical protein HDU92_006027 [Lobulomyces angularis]